MRESGLDYSSAFTLVASDPEFGSEFSNDVDASKADERLAGAEKRRDQLQAKVRELMAAGMGYDAAFRKALRDDPKLIGWQSQMLDPQRGLIQFNYREGQDIVASKTDADQIAGARKPVESMPKTDLGQKGVVGDWADKSVRPYVATRVQGAA
jgi:hypothetical protein